MNVFAELENHVKDMLPSDERLEYIAFLGDASGTVKAKGNNNVYVLRHDKSVDIVRNTKVPTRTPKIAVVVGYAKDNPTLLQVLRMVNAYLDPPYPPIPEHAEVMHSRWGTDPVYVTNEQFLPGLAFPTALTGLTLDLRGMPYYLEGWHVLDNQTGTTAIDITALLPASGACWVAVDVDVDKVVSLRAGSTVASRELLTPENIPLILSNKKFLFAVKAYAGQTRIVQNKFMKDIFDPRFAGVSSGGIATAIDWSDILNIPATFPPDLTITDPLYIHRWERSGDPTITDDISAGYLNLDVWLNTATGKIFELIDNSAGAAVWEPMGGGGGGIVSFAIDGHLAVVEGAASAFIFTADMAVPEFYMFLENSGTSGSTIMDLILRRVGDADVSIFEDGIYIDNRPELQWDDTDGLVIATPYITEFLAGDVLIPNVDQVAVGASDAVLAGGLAPSGSGASFNLTVSDGVTTVENVGRINVNGAPVIDETGGVITIDFPTPDAPIDPLTDISGCVVCLRASAITASDGDLIATWADESVSANDATQTTAGAKPIYRTNIFNGQPALSFDGARHMAFGTNIDLSACTVFIVFSTFYKAGYANALIIKRFGVYSLLNTIGWGVYRAATALMHGDFFPSNAGIACVKYSTSVTDLYSSGRRRAVSGGSDAANATSRVGWDGSGTQTHVGYIAEVLIYNTSLSDADRISIEKYLAMKYDIKIGSGL